ncbi:MAG: DUF362 domain-containing protein [Planctomycetota bacterium]|jgi:uncharacterized protein (DUF362 family)
MTRFALAASPFNDTPDRPQVYVEGGYGPYENTRRALANLNLSSAKGKRVMLKPNIGRMAKPGDAVTTEPQVVAAAIDAFQEAGATVMIAESPIVGVNTMEAFEICGITPIAVERDVPLYDMDVHPPIDVEVPEGRAIKKLRICREMTEVDLVVSIPVMKMHMHTGVTLSLKNMKGCLWRRSKVKLHMLPPVPDCDEKPINVAIADMIGLLTPHLAIIDGTVGMQGLGPSAGETCALDTVVVGADPLAADAVACRLMGTDVNDSPHLYMAAERGYGIASLQQIEVSPSDWEARAKVFDRPPENIAISFPGTRIHDENSCSACQSTLLLFLKRYGDRLFEYFSEEEGVDIAIGKGHDHLPDGCLCVGNCTAKHREKGIFVKGCPPVASEILKAVSGHREVDSVDGDQTEHS